MHRGEGLQHLRLATLALSECCGFLALTIESLSVLQLKRSHLFAQRIRASRDRRQLGNKSRLLLSLLGCHLGDCGLMACLNNLGINAFR